jgi:hypothetical protein
MVIVNLEPVESDGRPVVLLLDVGEEDVAPIGRRSS